MSFMPWQKTRKKSNLGKALQFRRESVGERRMRLRKFIQIIFMWTCYASRVC